MKVVYKVVVLNHIISGEWTCLLFHFWGLRVSKFFWLVQGVQEFHDIFGFSSIFFRETYCFPPSYAPYFACVVLYWIENWVSCVVQVACRFPKIPFTYNSVRQCQKSFRHCFRLYKLVRCRSDSSPKHAETEAYCVTYRSVESCFFLLLAGRNEEPIWAPQGHCFRWVKPGWFVSSPHDQTGFWNPSRG